MRLHGRAVSPHAEVSVLRRFSRSVRSRFSWCAKVNSFFFKMSACRNCAVYSELSSISQIQRVNVSQQEVSFSSTKKEHMLKSWRREGKNFRIPPLRMWHECRKIETPEHTTQAKTDSVTSSPRRTTSGRGCRSTAGARAPACRCLSCPPPEHTSGSTRGTDGRPEHQGGGLKTWL